MTQFQVRPKDEAESRAVQEAMFALGYGWLGLYGGRIKTISARPPVIFASSDGYMTHADTLNGDRRLSANPLANPEKIIAEAAKRRQITLAPDDPTDARMRSTDGPSRGAPVNREAREMGEAAYTEPQPRTFPSFWMVKDIGEGASGTHVMHNTFAKAAAEAKRLAAKSPGRMFAVVEAVGAWRVDPGKPEAYLPTSAGPR